MGSLQLYSPVNMMHQAKAGGRNSVIVAFQYEGDLTREAVPIEINLEYEIVRKLLYLGLYNIHIFI